MASVRLIEPGEHVPTADQRVVLHRVPWSHYEAQLALRGDVAAPRLSYLDGAMELMTPSKDHERIKSYLGRLVEAFALERGIELSPYGSWTLKQPLRQSGVEPDECYLIGGDQSRDLPDLAIEVVWTSGGIDKLEAYRRLGVAEVWLWRDGQLEAHVLRGDRYEPSPTSLCLPGLDIPLLASFLDRPTVLQAVRAYRAALAGGG
ncbi:MAG: Uma2 family endonuclease [Deltaproteobacteria bacterium]|nr:Uma2 family endonuclease [Deltaproteobacteria bacterium]